MKELFNLQSREIFEEIRSAGRIGVKFVERQIFVNKVSSMNWQMLYKCFSQGKK